MITYGTIFIIIDWICFLINYCEVYVLIKMGSTYENMSKFYDIVWQKNILRINMVQFMNYYVLLISWGKVHVLVIVGST